ncbi:hypothetical protein [Allohahella marinimesophila]|uniref:Phospholipid methyltransferase n=1 Tax=Allohahella marinimesophila TaxID=1054972 RepID=A0ABP7Q7B2_9GAMM
MNDAISHSGAWGLTLIVIVLISWFFYRYFAPKNWREWADAGVVQALIIALLGEGVVHWPTLFSIGLFPVIVLVYTWLARREEQHMLEEFGDNYLAYKHQVPMFIPRWGSWRQLAAASRDSGDSNPA